VITGYLCKKAPGVNAQRWGVGRTVGLVAESDVDRLVEEDGISVFGPNIQVVFSEGDRGGRRGDVLRD